MNDSWKPKETNHKMYNSSRNYREKGRNGEGIRGEGGFAKSARKTTETNGTETKSQVILGGVTASYWTTMMCLK